nr:putative ribonuclease H-like domain-containing protein [Tanacetum cinerariifolium]
MALTFVDTHNMIAFLTKLDASKGFNQIIDFLNASSIKYALIINPNIYVSVIKQFWSSVAVKKVKDVSRLQTLVDRKKEIITKATIRDALHLNDAEGIQCLPNEEIFTELARIGVGKGCSGVETPIFEGIIVAQQVAKGAAKVNVEDVPAAGVTDEGAASVNNDEVPAVGRIIADMDADKDVTLKDVAAIAKDVQDAEIEESLNDVDIEPAEPQEVVKVVTTAKLITEVVTAAIATITTPTPLLTTAASPTLTTAPSAARRRKGVVIRDLEESATPSTIIHTEAKSKDKGKRILVEEPKPLKKKEKKDNAVKRYQALKRKPQTEPQARKNMTIYLRNMTGFKMDYFKGMTYDDIRLIFEKKFNSNVAFLQKTKEQMEEEDSRALKRLSESQEDKAAKKQKLDEEVEELRKHLMIVPNKDDDVYTEATPLALKVPVVEYEIHIKTNKTYYTIKKADRTHQLYLSFLSMLRNFNREDLEVLWNLVKQIFASTKPKHFSDDFLLTTLDRKYPLTRFTLDQMLNNVRLKVEEESEVSLKLLSFRVDAAKDFKENMLRVKGPTVTAVKVSQHALKDKGVIDSGLSRYMIGNMSYMSDFKELNCGYVAFGGNPKCCKISGKGKIKTRKLDFDDVYFVKELKFNLFIVSQMCDKKNIVLFTDTKCLVLSPEFMLPDANQVLLRIPRENNMYNVDLNNIVPSRDLTCLFAKATLDYSNLWHRRLGHINFKTMNKLVKCNLIRGLPSKVFKNNHTCVACKKGKQHRSSCKTKPVSSVNQPLQRLHMDLFGPTFVKSLNKKSYFLDVIDDYSRFTWVFFLATKDETSPILKTFITGIENQLSLKVQIIRSDNRTELKNNDLNQFYGIKGIKREFSVPKTPQENGIAERKNMTLIVAARTMPADSLLPIPFWAEAINIACYVQNRVLVTKPQNKTPYELLHGRTPSIGFMRPFGCLVTILNTLDPLNKFDRKVDEGFLVRYSVSSKAFRVFNSRTRIFQETLHINFLENKPNVTEFKDFSDDNINKVNAADSPVFVVGQISINSTNTFSAVGPSNAVVKLEDITYSDDEEDVAGSKSRPPMLNKENYVPWSSRLLRYAKSRLNRKLIHNSILNGPYVRRMITEPGDDERDVNVNETFHEQTDDELSERE